MPLDARLKEFLVCPQCKGGLALADGGQGLLCDRCKLKYPIRSGIPVMLIDEALDLRDGHGAFAGASVKLPRAAFRVIAGPDANMTFNLEQGTCRAIGRAQADPNRTTVFNIDLALALDEGTKSLILQYVSKQFQRATAESRSAGEKLGIFRRAGDIVLTDPSLSRLHAMLFSDGDNVAVLDLVSKNGTYVNGVEIESKMLNRGDTVELGDTAISFER
jgi:uncharacterized protein